MSVRILAYDLGYRIQAWKQIQSITSCISVNFLRTDIFENRYRLLSELPPD